MAETERHRNLKALALLWAQARGYTCAALEVALPRCNFRADLAAYKPIWSHAPQRIGGASWMASGASDAGAGGEDESGSIIGATAVFECKQSRGDLLNDCTLALAASAELQALHERRATLEKLLRVHHPSLANGDSLFSEWTSFSFESLNHRGYQSVLRKIAVAQRKILLNNKFEKLLRYRCANVFYLVVEEGICAEHELPLGWGLLVRRDGRGESSVAGGGENLALVRKPLWQDIPEFSRLALLQRIALAGTRMLNARLGITFEDRIEAQRAE